jgi:acetolactate synthase regulatory subunit
VAEAHPGTIGRLVEVVAKRGMVPSYLHGVVGGRRGDELAVDLQVAGLDGAARDLVAAQLRALVPVRAVLTSVKSFVD